MTEQIEKIKQLIASANNPKQKAMYQQLLAKLETENSPEIEAQVEPPTNEVKSELVKPKKIIAPKIKTELTAEPAVSQEPKEPKPKNDAIFQAVGIITGEVTLGDVSTIKLGDTDYRLYYISGKRRFAYDALKKEIEATGNTRQRLIVYPRILHFPGRDKPHIVAFQLVGFISQHNKKPSTIDSELKDFEFKVCGLWQFIPVCRTPCISVFRNFTKDRLAWIKEAEATRKVKFMKASHLPLLWKDSPVRPFRFNPRLEKEQQEKTYFVELKVRFLPGRDVFGFVELLSEPTEERPNFFKASKKMKADALQEANLRQREMNAEGLPESSPKPREVKPTLPIPKPVKIAPVINAEVSETPTPSAEPDTTPPPVSDDSQQVSGVFDPETATFEELKAYIRGIQSDDETRKYGSLAKKDTWLEAFKNLN